MVVTDNDILAWGVATVTLAGETECGDGYLVRSNARGMLIAVVDGLGHGAEAARAANLAIETLKEAQGDETLITLMQRCHQRLVRTRGIVMSMMEIDAAQRQLTWIGVGNVEGRLAPRQEYGTQRFREFLLLPGIVGLELPLLREVTVPIARRDLMVLATDGVNQDFRDAIDHDSEPSELARKIVREHGNGDDDVLVMVARFTG